MNSITEDEDKGLLYLHHVTVETPVKSGYRVKLHIDGSDIQLTRTGQTSIWAPPKSLEVSESSKIKVTLKSGHTIASVSFRKEESVIDIDVQAAVRQFLVSMQYETSVSEKSTFHQLPVTIVVVLRPSPTLESVRSTLQSLQESMYQFRHIMGDSTQKHSDTIIKYGLAFSERDPRSKAAFSVLTITFELLEQQKESDQMVSGLVRQLKRVLRFADETLKEAVEDNTDILRKAIGRLYTLTMDVSEFCCDYVKRNRFSKQSDMSQIV
ncbi:hypothetical protein FRC15_008678 [Serendipita sp. 397]|nr:hypothetical protein FRC15_008678 [Serendipita sp. 397]